MSPPVHSEVQFVLDEMRRMHDEMRSDLQIIRYEQIAMGKELAGLKVKAGAWGMIAGCIPVALVGAWLFIKQLLAGEMR